MVKHYQNQLEPPSRTSYKYIMSLIGTKNKILVIFFVLDYQIISYGLMALSLCCAGLG